MKHHWMIHFFFAFLFLACGHIQVVQLPLPVPPEMDRFKMTWQDEFNGTSLDTTKWQAPDKMQRQGGSRWMKDMVSVSNGLLHLGIKLTADPVLRYDCGAVRTMEDYWKPLFKQVYGYFEIRCKLPGHIDQDYWAAFWMMAGEISDDQDDTREGSEIDIMESFTFADATQHRLTLHWNGYGTLHNSWALDLGAHPEIMDGGFHTFGFYWDKKKYVSFVDGKEVGRTDFMDKGSRGVKTPSRGPCRKPAYIKLSCEADQWPGGPGWKDPPIPEDDFVVDYVRVYSGSLR